MSNPKTFVVRKQQLDQNVFVYADINNANRNRLMDIAYGNKFGNYSPAAQAVLTEIYTAYTELVSDAQYAKKEFDRKLRGVPVPESENEAALFQKGLESLTLYDEADLSLATVAQIKATLIELGKTK